MNTDLMEKERLARAALEEARAAHARAVMDTVASPDDTEAKTLHRIAVREAREALRAYRDAATAGIATQIGDTE